MELKKILPYTKELKVLYVEDDENILVHTKEVFDDIFGSVSTAINGKDGLLEYEAHVPEYFDIVITDIKMPEKDGISMIEDIIKINKEQTIIAVSSYNEPNILMQLIQLGVSNFIMKPFTATYLINTLYTTAKAIYDNKEKIKLQNELATLRKKREFVDVKMNTIETIIRDISHQWKQPLSAIMVCASGMKLEKSHKMLNDDIFNKRCDDIIANVEYLAQTIKECNNYYTSHTQSKLILAQNIDENISNLQKNLEEHHIVIEKKLDYSLTVDTSITNFSQVITCIINNAVDALQKMISLERYIIINLYKDKNNIYLTIKDNAEGIQEDIMNDIFNLYATTKHRSLGIGFGLHNVYKIVKNDIGGTIDVSNVSFSLKDKTYYGAQFTITMPLTII